MKATSAVLGAMLAAGAASSVVAFAPPKFATNLRRGNNVVSIRMSGEPDTMTLERPQEATEKQEPFVNDGPFSFMQDFLFLHKDGKSMRFAIPVDADSTKPYSDEQIAAEKETLRKNLMNIGTEERQRRSNAADVFQVITALYVFWAALIGDQGDLSGHVLRFLVVLPLFFTIGFRDSADKGM